MPLLSELLARVGATFTGDDVMIHDVTADSRQVKHGSLYVAMRGATIDGAHYIPDALQRGAAAIVVDHATKLGMATTAPVVQVADTRAAIGALANAFYPALPEHLYAVTGTDGKTSTADFLRQLATLLGHRAASIGTLGLRSDVAPLNQQYPAINTSPEPVLLRRMLASLAQAGVTHAAIEASSHGLDQKRLDGLPFTAAAFTNLTRDHLDYHGTLEAYAAAKARLFAELLPGAGRAVLNRDDGQYEALKRMCDARGIGVRSFGHHSAAEYRIDRVRPHAHGLDASITINGAPHDLALPIYGAFQLMNMLAALALLEPVAMGDAIALLPQLRGVPGRLEKIGEKNGAPIFVDYAHTPAALANILKTLRAHTQNKLHVVFGCGGDRDAGKRPEMGRAAAQHADHVIVTDDNPRNENPAAIRAAIVAAAPQAQNMGDRAAAIHAAVQQLEPGDVLVVAGKGHETTQTIGAHVIPFSDAEQIREAV